MKDDDLAKLLANIKAKKEAQETPPVVEVPAVEIEPEEPAWEFPTDNPSVEEESLEEILAGIEAEVLSDVASADSTLAKQSESKQQPEEELDFEFQSQYLLHELEGTLEAAEEQYNSTENEWQKLQDEKVALQKQLTELAKRISALEGVRYDYSASMRRINRQIGEAKEEVEREQANKDAADRLKELQSTFEARTELAPWRVGYKDTFDENGQPVRITVPVLYPHQHEAAKAIGASDGRILVADGMGLGKTPECIAGLGMLDEGSLVVQADGSMKLINDGTMPGLNILFIVPGETQKDFYEALKRWSYYEPFMIGRESKSTQKNVLEMISKNGYKGQAVICNYESWSRNKNLLKWLKSVGFDAVVCDEAHRIKDHENQTFRGVADVVFSKNKCPKCGSLFSDETDWLCPNNCTETDAWGYTASVPAVSTVKYFVAMTGTFIMNNPQEMYASLHLARPDIFRHHSTFTSRFVDWTGKAWNAGGQARLAQEISGFYIRRTREDAGITLPKQTTYIHEIEIQQDEYELQYKLLDMLRQDAEIQILNGDKDGMSFPVTSLLALITRQRQATVWPGGIYMKMPVLDDMGFGICDEEGKQIYERVHVGASYQQSAKMDKAVELWSEMRDGGYRIAVFSQFREALDEFQRRVETMGSVCGKLHGGATDKHKDAVKRNFDRMYGETPVWDTVVCHYLTGGVGLNLTAATGMIILDEPWNDATESQAQMRLDRIGQTEETQVHILNHVGPQKSIDLWLSAIIKFKKDVVAGFNKATEYRKAFQ